MRLSPPPHCRCAREANIPIIVDGSGINIIVKHPQLVQVRRAGLDCRMYSCCFCTKTACEVWSRYESCAVKITQQSVLLRQ